MNEAENLAQWSMVAAVTQIECVDQAEMLECFGGRQWVDCVTVCKKVTVLEAVMYLKCKGLSWLGEIPNGSPGLTCSERACWTMRMAAATGHSWELIASQEKQIFSLFCLPPNAHRCNGG